MHSLLCPRAPPCVYALPLTPMPSLSRLHSLAPLPSLLCPSTLSPWPTLSHPHPPCVAQRGVVAGCCHGGCWGTWGHVCGALVPVLVAGSWGSVGQGHAGLGRMGLGHAGLGRMGIVWCDGDILGGMLWRGVGMTGCWAWGRPWWGVGKPQGVVSGGVFVVRGSDIPATAATCW
jgi:hypothetical protein